MALSAPEATTISEFLSNSLNGDQTVRKLAETALSQSENRPGFCSWLLEVITAQEEVDVLFMATVYLKHSINLYWQTRRDSMPELFSALAQQLQSADKQLQSADKQLQSADKQLQSADAHRKFLVLFRTLKELSTKQLTSDQRNYAEISSHFFDYCWHLWQSDVQKILHGFSDLAHNFSSNVFDQHQNELHLICERWCLCLKIIRQLVMSGHQSDSKSMQEVQQVKEVSPMLLSAIQSIIPYYPSFPEQHPRFWDFMGLICNILVWRFIGALSLELTNDHPNMRVTHQKVALLLGQWVSEVLDLISILVGRIGQVIPYVDKLVNFFQKGLTGPLINFYGPTNIRKLVVAGTTTTQVDAQNPVSSSSSSVLGNRREDEVVAEAGVQPEEQRIIPLYLDDYLGFFNQADLILVGQIDVTRCIS